MRRAFEIAEPGQRGFRGRVEVGRAADEIRHDRSERVQDLAARVPCGHLSVAWCERGEAVFPPGWEPTGQRERKRVARGRVRRTMRRDPLLPRGLELPALLHGGSEDGEGVVGHEEG